MAASTQKNNIPQLISYIALRRAVGILGIAFPILLVLGSVIFGGCQETQKSISIYYHTAMRDLFVGVLCAIAFFLFTYKGYDSKDSIAGTIACFFAVGVAFFPTSFEGPFTSCLNKTIDNGVIDSLHFICAGALFITLAYLSICRFTKTKKEAESCLKRLHWKHYAGRPVGKKLIRNKIYVTCGLIMLACILLIGIYCVLDETQAGQRISALDPIFWLETIALWAFGTSWLIKGRTLFSESEV